jgi:hypothetical protein
MVGALSARLSRPRFSPPRCSRSPRSHTPTRVRASALPTASGAPPHDAQEPHPRGADHLRSPATEGDLFGHAGRELLDRLAIPDPWRRTVGQPAPDRRSGAADRQPDLRAAPPGRRPSLHPAAGHRARIRLDQRLHRRVGDRRHRTLPVASEAGQLHRPMPARVPVRQHRPAAARSQSMARAICGGGCSRPR